MSQSCDCNDYSKLSANTGAVTISTANSNLDGTGKLYNVLTGAKQGTSVKSVIIKSIAPTSVGMIRLFIGKGGQYMLYREIPIPTYPNIPTTPTPSPIWPMIEIDLTTTLKLEDGATLMASTQNAESFNIIAEGLDWEYPTELPDVCCNFRQESAVIGVGTPAPNDSLDGSGQIETIFTAGGSYGANINTITISALQSTHTGMIRFFVNNGSKSILMMEIVVPETTQSAFQPSFKQELKVDFALQAGYSLGATTQNPEPFAITIDATEWTYPI